MQFATPLDLHWTGRPRSIAAALLRAKNFTALLDPGPSSTLPRLRNLLQQHDLRIADLQAIFLTHIHLDHAAATGSLLRENPALRVYVHGKGAPHLIDPAKLLESAGRLFGEDRHRLFGDFLAVPRENLEILQGGEVLAAGSRELQVFYTPGHASHHLTYFEPEDGVAYVGDTTGIRVQGDAFVLPAMPPPMRQRMSNAASFPSPICRRWRRRCGTRASFRPRPPQPPPPRGRWSPAPPAIYGWRWVFSPAQTAPSSWR